MMLSLQVVLPRALIRRRPALPNLSCFVEGRTREVVVIAECCSRPYWASTYCSSFSSSASYSRGLHYSQQQQSQRHSRAPNPSKGTQKKRRRRNVPPQVQGSTSVLQERKDDNDDDNNNNKLIRLTKRMSELDICSRREAERFILDGRVLLKGQLVEPIHGIKVSPQENDIVLLTTTAAAAAARGQAQGKTTTQGGRRGEEERQQHIIQASWETTLQTAAVVLHKPVGFVSGQPENHATTGIGTATDAADMNSTSGEAYIPAVRLLTPSNAHIVRSNYHDSQEYQEAKRIVQNRLHFDYFHRDSQEMTLQNYVPAGRLDLDSSGLLIFTNQGVLAKKLISNSSSSGTTTTSLEKEYWVVLEPIQGYLTKEERARGMTDINQLPSRPTRNLKSIRQGGFTLFGDYRPLRPVVDAEWTRWEDQTVVDSTTALQTNARRKLLRIVLREGRKHQIRRMCREILGMHVVRLIRTKIGPNIVLNPSSLPEGKWRPLRRLEVESILASS